jgi:hypothetical protein
MFLDIGTRRGWGVSVTPRPHSTPGKDPVPIVQEAGWTPGPVWTGAENLAPTGIRSPDRPARSQSLYRLSYPAHKSIYLHTWKASQCKRLQPAHSLLWHQNTHDKSIEWTSSANTARIFNMVQCGIRALRFSMPLRETEKRLAEELGPKGIKWEQEGYFGGKNKF